MSEYILDTGSALGRIQMDHLERMLDAATTSSLDATGIKPGQRCLTWERAAARSPPGWPGRSGRPGG